MNDARSQLADLIEDIEAMGNRITEFLNDAPPELWESLARTEGSITTRDILNVIRVQCNIAMGTSGAGVLAYDRAFS